MDKFQLGNYCCSESTITLRFCKAITLHKSQGASIGPGKDSDTAVVTRPTTQPGMELVALSRATSKEPFSIWDDGANSVTVEDLKVIGWSKSYDDRRNFENMLREKEEQTHASLIPQIAGLDNNCTTSTFGGRFQWLIQWFSSKVNSS